ncbi:hypothetical protein N9M36_01355 [Flavobacteriaceae bacterium]|nr:hypothetical protein [Flavobacteriaceae bacterium]
MLIKYIQREHLDEEKYNDCIENSIQSNSYAFSWYLDIVCDNWDVLVLDDYEAVMPIPWRKKYGIKYVYPPLWVLQLGVYSNEAINENEFLTHLFSTFKFVELRMNTHNNFELYSEFLQLKQCQKLVLNTTYSSILSKYRKDRKKDLQKATTADLIEKWNDHPSNLIELFKNNIGKRTPNIKENDYQNLEKLIAICIQKKVGEILAVYDKKNKLVASVFLLKHKNSITKLISSTNLKDRKNGANTFLIDRVIFKYHKDFSVFNFGGSSIKSVASFSKSFGAETEKYHQLKMNKLPKVLQLFKK